MLQNLIYWFFFIFFTFSINSLGPPMMNLYILLLYTFKNANTQADLDAVNILSMEFNHLFS